MNEAVVSMKSDAEWQAESDLNTLIEAKKIEKDSKRLKAVMARKKMLLEALNEMPNKTSHKKKSKASPAY